MQSEHPLAAVSEAIAADKRIAAQDRARRAKVADLKAPHLAAAFDVARVIKAHTH